MSDKHINVLLADDDTDDCYFFNKAVAALPLLTQLKVVSDGEQLMKYLAIESNPMPDVLFLDINMPRKNGVECVHEMQKDARLKAIPVVMFSTSKNEEIMKSLFKAGVHIYIRKPGNFDQLKEVIANALPIAAQSYFATSNVKYILNA